MDVDNNKTQYFTELAKNSLDAFSTIADDARKRLNDGPSLSSATLAASNSFTGGNVSAAMGETNRQLREAWQTLLRQPAIARVVTVDENDKRNTYFICSGTPQLRQFGDAEFASSNSDFGRFASQPIGFGYTVGPPGNRRYLEVVEAASLAPEEVNGGWDALETRVRSADFETVFIASLRALVEGGLSPDEAADEIDRILAAAQADELFRTTRSRNIIGKMSLRSQPNLDQFQDNIFRLPINKRLAILGPPGTGKTTTLIRRLGQKTQTNFLDVQENDVVERSFAGSTDHVQSWLMLTPTDLLKQFVKAAFDDNNIPAPDQRLKTWTEYRRHLARNVFGYLSNGRGGGLIMPEPVHALTLSGNALANPIGWYEGFASWQSNMFWTQLRQAAERLSTVETETHANIGQRLTSALNQTDPSALVRILLLLSDLASDCRNVSDEIKIETDKVIRTALTLAINRESKFLDDFAVFLDGIGSSNESEDNDEDEDEDEDELPLRQTGKAAAISAYGRAVRTLSKSRTRGRRSVAGRTGKIVEWLGENRLPSDTQLLDVGKKLQIRSDFQRFVAPARTYINKMGLRYRQFRRENRAESTWYEGEKPEINPLEADIILLAASKALHMLLGDAAIMRRLDAPAFASLKSFASEFRNQIVVDEATDFSPIQLACMAALSDPQLNSVFVCGDYNQRLTAWGSRTDTDLEWAIPGVDIKPVSVAYRQTNQLHQLALDILEVTGGNMAAASLPPEVDNDGLDPVLGLGLAEIPELADWLAERIREIEQATGRAGLPSTAVFVNSEDQVKPLADALNAALQEFSIRAAPCHEGRMIGEASEVRVFDIQNIKGLEFEAVFFVGIDQLAAEQSDLFAKYMYVGATRAATYLGLTCTERSLPQPIDQLAMRFKAGWE